MGVVHPVEAEDLSAREALQEMRVGTARAEAELDKNAFLVRQPPGRDADANALGDLLKDVRVKSAHALTQV